MLTNLLCYIYIFTTLSTNTATIYLTHKEYRPPPAWVETHNLNPAFGPWDDVTDANPTQKDVVTTVTETTHVKFTLNGNPWESEQQRELSRVTNRFELATEWKPSTNAPIRSRTWLDRNGLPVNIIMVTNTMNVWRLTNSMSIGK